MKHLIRRYAIALIAMMTAALPMAASAQDGGTQSPFALGAGSRAIGLGRSVVATSDDASAIYWNPASLRQVQSKQVMGMYMSLFGDFTDATYTYLGLSYPTMSAGALGIGLLRVSSDFDGFDESSVPTGTQDYSETELLLGYAFERRYKYTAGRTALGANFKIANQQLADLSSTAPRFDVGVLYHPDYVKGLAIGLNLQDVAGGSHKLVQQSDNLYGTIMLGAGYTYGFDNGGAFQLMAQLDMPERADNQIHLGAEYRFQQYVALRVGWDDEDISFGLGFDVSAFGLDYAFLSRDGAGSSHPVTFTATWGKTVEEMRQAAEEQRLLEEQLAIQAAFESRIQSHRELARQFESEGDIPGAMDEWKIVLEYVPGDEMATTALDSLTQAQIAEQARQTQNLEQQATINAHFTQGLRLYQENDYLRAKEEWLVILAIDSTHTEANDYLDRTQAKIDEQVTGHIQRANRLENQSRLTEAIGEWNNVQLLDPDNGEAQQAIDRIRQKIESQSQNLQQASRRLRIVNLYNAALQAFNQGSYQDAIRDCEEVLKLEPTHEDATTLLAMAKRKTTPLTKEEEETIRRLYLAGMQFFSKDQYAQAIAEWEKILKIDPTNESVKRNIEEARIRLEQLEEDRDE